MKRFVKLLTLFCFPVVAMAQLETTLPNLERLNQATYINPGILPAYSVSVGTPILSGLGLTLNLNGVNADMAIKSLDSNRINMNKLYDKLNEKNVGIGLALNYEIFHVRFKSKNWFYGINLNNRLITEVGISKELIGFAAYGNDYFAGRDMDASSTQISNIAFNELGFSMSRKLNAFTFGFRAKFLQGIAATQFENFQFKWSQPQNSTGEVILTTGGTLNTASLPYLQDSLNGKPYESKMSASNFFSFKNSGYGLDIGGTYAVNDKLTIGASIVDFGWIKWNSEAYNYTSSGTQIKFSGMGTDQATTDSLMGPYFDSIIKRAVPVASNNSFTTFLPWRMFISASYKVGAKNKVGALFQTRHINGDLQKAYSISFTRTCGKNLDITTNYSIIGQSYTNIGLGLAAKTGAFQWYIMQDNLFGYFKPSTAQVVSLRLGFNLIWGDLSRTGTIVPKK